MTFHIITLFPRAFDSYFGESILKRAIADKKIKVKFYNPRDFTKDKHRRIDCAPYGGGPGMVIQAEPIIRAIDKAYSDVLKNTRIKSKKLNPKPSTLNPKIILLSPNGKQFTNNYGRKLAQKFTDVIIICGRYEGIDARVKRVFKVEEISVGPYILTGGELAALTLVDVMSRQVPGVLGDINSLEETRVSNSDVYTRPEIFKYKGKSCRVPKVLLSGNHREIEAWKLRHNPLLK